MLLVLHNPFLLRYYQHNFNYNLQRLANHIPHQPVDLHHTRSSTQHYNYFIIHIHYSDLFDHNLHHIVHFDSIIDHITDRIDLQHIHHISLRRIQHINLLLLF